MNERRIRGVPYILSVPPDPRYPPFWIPAIKITTWSPSTCYCTVNYWWDRRVPAERRKHRFCSSRTAAAIRPDKLFLKDGKLRHRERKNWRWQEVHCDAHAGLKGEEWLLTLIKENIEKIDRKALNETQLMEILVKTRSRKRVR